MKKIITLITLLATAMFAQLNVATTYNYLGKVTKRIGGDLVKIDVLASPKLDPDFATNIDNIVPISELISMKLSQLDPTNQATYNKNFKEFKSKMEELTGATVKNVPHDVGAVDGTDMLEDFYTTIGKELCQ